MSLNHVQGNLEAQDRSPQSGPPPERHSILIIEDHDLIRKALRLVLGRKHDVVACASAEEGVARVHEDLCTVVLDIRMSHHDGFWACDRIREKLPSIPVIFYSAYQDAKEPYRIINEHRPFAYIVKDGTTNRLVEAVDRAVRLYSVILRNRRIADEARGARETLELMAQGRGRSSS